ncbi:MGDG synthase family glycosyltransferase [Helicovermis profundi]|uniref:Glycosyltransferase n=1 Tax=Helicovermis profundi TaxID=3065157 RepID=A0AAU9E628_9FIRM|nr:glycosyltransferase [Clostridia bacterium S502]
MSEKSNILIFTTSFGMGHLSVANAIKEQLINENKENIIEIVDILDVSNPKTKDIFFNTYKFLTSKHENIYNYFYKIKKDVPNNYIDGIMYNMYLKKVAKYIMHKNPDLIISTFPMCSGFVSKAKAKYDLKIPLITSITDVVDSWEWIHSNTDMYFVPSKVVGEKLVGKGIDEKQIKVTGIPVKNEFLQYLKKENSKKQLLIMGGVMDKLGIDQVVLDKLDGLSNVKTVIVTGNNKVLYDKLSKNSDYKNIEILGYTTEIAKFMSESDVLVTKPGGATLFEAINKGLPMIIKNSNVGQEEENIKYIREKGIGILIEDSESIEDIIIDSLSNTSVLELLRLNISNIKNEINPHLIGKYALELI